MLGLGGGEEEVEVVGEVMAASLGWGERRREAEVEEAKEMLRRKKEMTEVWREELKCGRKVSSTSEETREDWRREAGKEGLLHCHLEAKLRREAPLATEEEVERRVRRVEVARAGVYTEEEYVELREGWRVDTVEQVESWSDQ